LCGAWAEALCFVDLCFFWVVVAAFASVAMTAMVGKTKPRDARRCLREKFTADSTEGKGFRDRTNNVW
jgi:hypothetical protein